METEEKLSEIFVEAKRLEDNGEIAESKETYTDVINKCLAFMNTSSTVGTSSSEIAKLLAQAYNNRGYQKYKQVDFDGAIEDYTKCLEEDKNMYVSFYNRGLIHYRLGRYEKATADMKGALNLQPDFEPAKKCLEQSLIDMERTKTNGR